MDFKGIGERIEEKLLPRKAEARRRLGGIATYVQKNFPEIAAEIGVDTLQAEALASKKAENMLIAANRIDGLALIKLAEQISQIIPHKLDEHIGLILTDQPHIKDAN